MLRVPVNFLLARLVILEPRLPPDATPLQNPQKQYVLGATNHLRLVNRTVSGPPQTRPSGEDPLYHAEKMIFADSEFRRAALLLYNTSKLSEAQADAVRVWINNRPGQEALLA